MVPVPENEPAPDFPVSTNFTEETAWIFDSCANLWYNSRYDMIRIRRVTPAFVPERPPLYFPC